MSRLPGVSSARDMAMCRATACFQTGRMPVGGMGVRRTWPKSGSCPIFRAQLQRLRSGKWNFYSSTSGEGRKARTFWYRLPGKGGPLYCSLVSNKNGPKTLLRTRMHQGGLRSLFAALIWASGIFWGPMRGSNGWRWQGYVCTAATFLPTILSRSLRPRSSSLKKAPERLVGGPLIWVNLIVSCPSGE